MEKDGNKNQRRWEELKVSSLLEWKGEKWQEDIKWGRDKATMKCASSFMQERLKANGYPTNDFRLQVKQQLSAA
jgi:hypothetical protein